ncbi:peptidase [Mycobacterium hubeiense]|uniref:peptidase n=1 Tax=Mycobacterium hubeiense TaxID=1867256 RepID=UPI000C7ED1CC|nr:peptidase [Mycobacterium sp. QGD 101]
MRPSTTSVATKRLLLGILLTELIFGVLLLGQPAAPQIPRLAAPAAHTTFTGGSTTLMLPDGRRVALVDLGGPDAASLLTRVTAEIADAANAVTAFWGPDWPREVTIAATATDEQFTALAGGGADIAAATTKERIVFAPGAAAMSNTALRIVLRHELFHYATRTVTASDAPRWLTEGVADFVGRPPVAAPRDAQAVLPTDTELDTAGPLRSLAYDRAWWFSSFVAEVYGTPALRALYLRACGIGHTDVGTAVRDTLGADLDEVLNRWRAWLTR